MSTDTGHTPDLDEIEKGWENPFAEATPLYYRFEKIIRENRDIIMIVDDDNAERGTGKTISSLQLAAGMDQTEEGLTPAKCTMDPEELRNAYVQMPKRSGLVLDEGEVGASNRDAMSKVNKALREITSMGRVQEKYLVINAPLKQFIDKDLQKLADVWISMTRRGRGLVHFFDWEKYSETLLTPQKQWLNFEDVPTDHQVRKCYQALTRTKYQKMEGVDGAGFIAVDEHEEAVEKARKAAKKEKRNEIIRGLVQHPEITPKAECNVSERMLGEALGVSQATINRIGKQD